ISGTNQAFEPRRYKERPGAAKRNRRSLRCRASARRSRRLPPSICKADSGLQRIRSELAQGYSRQCSRSLCAAGEGHSISFSTVCPLTGRRSCTTTWKRPAEKARLFYLSGYPAELNPDELVWSYVKRTGTARHPLACNESLKSAAREHPGAHAILLPGRRCLLYH